MSFRNKMRLLLDHVITLAVNGSGSLASVSSVEPYTWNGTEDRAFYLGKSMSSYFSGQIDEVRLSVTRARTV